MNIYQENILDHYKNPRNFGKLRNPDIVSKDANTLCGDEIEIQIKLKDGKIENIKFRGPGCAISRASGSILTEFVKGKTLDEVKRIKENDLIELIGIDLSPIRKKCALLALKVLKKNLK